MAGSPYESCLNKRVISEVTPRYVHSGTVYRTLAGEEARKWDEIGWEMYVSWLQLYCAIGLLYCIHGRERFLF